MQEATFEKYEEPAEVAPSRFARIRTVVSTAVGAVIALSLLLALGVWFYRLGVRDAQNVPIIRASTDPAKVRPEDPGGTTAPHQDVKSYEIAESGEPSAVAALVAPEPEKPTREDVAMGELEPEAANEVDQLVGQVLNGSATQPQTPAPAQAQPLAAVTVAPAAPSDAQPAPAADPDQAPVPATAPQPSQSADEPVDVAALSTPAPSATPSEAQPEPAAAAAQPDAEPEPEPEVTAGSEWAPANSPLVRSRPADLAVRQKEAVAEAQQDHTDLVAAAANSSVQIQLAANPSEDVIRNQWRRVYDANKDILRDKALAVQTTQSGGTTFYRLRVGPFRNRSEAVAVCQALKARGQDCIVARNS